MVFLLDINFQTLLCLLAGIIYWLNKKRLSKIEKFILVIISLNIIADTIAIFLRSNGIENGFVYNILAPVERTITLIIYICNSHIKREKTRNYLGIGMVISISLVGFTLNQSQTSFHDKVYVISGLLIAILSYLHLRSIVLDKSGQSILIFVFAIANLVYFPLMISFMSALKIALNISKDFGVTILIGNIVAYCLWSIILIIGIPLWKRKRI